MRSWFISHLLPDSISWNFINKSRPKPVVRRTFLPNPIYSAIFLDSSMSGIRLGFAPLHCWTLVLFLHVCDVMSMYALLHAQRLVSSSTALQHLPLNLELGILARLLTIKFSGQSVSAHPDPYQTQGCRCTYHVLLFTWLLGIYP